jgi:hypothetical protein
MNRLPILYRESEFLASFAEKLFLPERDSLPGSPNSELFAKDNRLAFPPPMDVRAPPKESRGALPFPEAEALLSNLRFSLVATCRDGAEEAFAITFSVPALPLLCDIGARNLIGPGWRENCFGHRGISSIQEVILYYSSPHHHGIMHSAESIMP